MVTLITIDSLPLVCDHVKKYISSVFSNIFINKTDPLGDVLDQGVVCESPPACDSTHGVKVAETDPIIGLLKHTLHLIQGVKEADIQAPFALMTDWYPALPPTGPLIEQLCQDLLHALLAPYITTHWQIILNCEPNYSFQRIFSHESPLQMKHVFGKHQRLTNVKAFKLSLDVPPYIDDDEQGVDQLSRYLENRIATWISEFSM